MSEKKIARGNTWSFKNAIDVAAAFHYSSTCAWQKEREREGILWKNFTHVCWKGKKCKIKYLIKKLWRQKKIQSVYRLNREDSGEREYKFMAFIFLFCLYYNMTQATFSHTLFSRRTHIHSERESQEQRKNGDINYVFQHHIISRSMSVYEFDIKNGWSIKNPS